MKVVCIGELLIDFICTDTNKQLHDGVHFIKKAGGAPANVAATVSKLGGKAEFIGKVGNDAFGVFLKRVLTDANVGTLGVSFDAEHPTTLAFVSLTDDGERDFVFNRGADGELTRDDVLIKTNQSEIYHFGSATALLPSVTRDTYLSIMEECSSKDEFVSFDPNYRSALWLSEDAFKAAVLPCLKWTHLLKVSEEELVLLGGSNDSSIGLEYLHELGCPFILVTLGKKGTLVSYNNLQKIVPSIAIKSIDSTGAGDAFIGAILYQLAKQRKVSFDHSELCQMVMFANKVGALTCTQMGAISAIPTLDQLKEVK